LQACPKLCKGKRQINFIEVTVDNLKADSHIACRSHAHSMPFTRTGVTGYSVVTPYADRERIRRMGN